MKKVILLLMLICNLAPAIREGEFSFISFSIVQAQYYGGAEIGHDIEDPICITPPSHISGSWDNGDGTYTSYSCTTTYSGCDDPGSTECSYYIWGDMAPKDCAGVAYGTAYVSDCGCVGGTTGRSENDCRDCNEDINGGAYVADCGCIGGNTGIASCPPPNGEDPPTVCDNPAFNSSDASVTKIVSPRPLPPGFMGLTMPESIAIEFTVCNDNGVWKPVLTKVFGRYSKTVNMGTVQEITGIGGNTTSANYCAQIFGLTKIPPNGIQWFMQSALEAHEEVHESRMLPTLTTDGTTITPLELIELRLESQDYFITDNGQTVNDVIASVTALIESSHLLLAAHDYWLQLAIEQGDKDHKVTYDATTGHPIIQGAAYLAELPITQPMKTAICEYASQNLLNGWTMCQYCF